MKFEDLFGISVEEFRDYMSQAVVADLCLQDMGRVAALGNFTHRDGLCYKAGVALLDFRDVLGNTIRERRPAYLCLQGLWVENLYSFNHLPEIEPSFDANVFRRESEEFIDLCMREAARIDGDRGTSYIMYGFYCLKMLKDPERLKKRMIPWERFV